MCATCWTAAGTTLAGATGLRAWAAAKRPDWLSEGRLRALTVALLTLAVLVAAVRV